MLTTFGFNIKKFVKFYKRTRKIAKAMSKANWTVEYGLSANKWRTDEPTICFTNILTGGQPSVVKKEFITKDLKDYCKEFNEDIDNINATLFIEKEFGN